MSITTIITLLLLLMLLRLLLLRLSLQLSALLPLLLLLLLRALLPFLLLIVAMHTTKVGDYDHHHLTITTNYPTRITCSIHMTVAAAVALLRPQRVCLLKT